MGEELISIGMTYYNASETIHKALRSACNQTWKNTEIIIVNDCSNEIETRLLQDLKGKFPQVYIFHLPENKGVASARNEIIRHAKGEFLCFFDDDDVSKPERIKKQHESIVNCELRYACGAPVISYTSRLQKYPNGQETYEKTLATSSGPVPNGERVALRILTGKPEAGVTGSAATCSQMARLSTYRLLHGFDDSFRRHEDTDFNVRAAFVGAYFVGLAEPLVVQTMTLTSDKNLSDEKRYALKLLQKHKNFVKKHTHYAFHKKWISTKYTLFMGNRSGFFMQIMLLLCRHPVLTMQRLVWAMPNMGLNLRFMRFHDGR